MPCWNLLIRQVLRQSLLDGIRNLLYDILCGGLINYECEEAYRLAFYKDGKTFYILHQTLRFATQHRNIDKNDLRIVNYCRNSLIFSDNKSWKKKSTDSCFDVTKGSFDGAEICELLGLYIQSRLEKILPKSNFGLYRDDGLALLRYLNGQRTDKVRENIIGVFNDIGFSLEIKTNLKEVDFLDVSLNLPNGTYRPYKKPNDRLLYIHSLSNHPQNVIKQIPSKRDCCKTRLMRRYSTQQNVNTKML